MDISDMKCVGGCWLDIHSFGGQTCGKETTWKTQAQMGKY